jgi:hypothetical protein
MPILDNIDNPSYPEPWHRQTPKGYDPHSNNEKVINNGLALKVFEEEVCDHCSCKTTVVNNLLESQTSFEE